MKLSIERNALLKALGHVQNVVERRNTIPILSNILLTAKEDSLTFVATDLDIEVSEDIKAQISAPGQVTAPAHTLYDIIRKLPDGAQVTLQINSEQRLDIDAGRSHFTLPLLPSGDFPKMGVDDFTHNFTIAASALRRVIDKTRFAISTEETRYYLNGIYMHAHNDMLRCVATDGHRLSLVETELPDGAQDLPGIIIPRKTVNEIRRLIDNVDADIMLSISEAKIRFQLGSIILISKLIDGSFPDYDRVIPKGNQKELVIDNKIFAGAVDRVATISAEKSRSLKMILSPDNLALSVNNPESGHAHEDLRANYSADPLEIGFNAKYLLDVTQQIDGPDASFWFDGPTKPALVKDSEDEKTLFVLMPLRV